MFIQSTVRTKINRPWPYCLAIQCCPVLAFTDLASFICSFAKFSCQNFRVKPVRMDRFVRWVGYQSHPITRWCPQSIAFSWFITIVNGVFKPIYNWGGHHLARNLQASEAVHWLYGPSLQYTPWTIESCDGWSFQPARFMSSGYSGCWSAVKIQFASKNTNQLELCPLYSVYVAMLQ